ncbi:T9SS type A sorting domain-containing protein [Dyadobacter sp. MSC1_007]|jgi:hypothetical protein|uniref:T9SS type A sorting domain-containing protein n=1 Tax=Dyadobacter sp. MSC1_007 TaxID=2909264 RepID=UPI00202DEE00|nr:T9SS type A sorting domain-containing protein [Dyadobacter sp. MSC1_007]
MKYLYTFVLALFALQSFAQTLETDRLALVAIYNQANGPDWGTNWVVPGTTGDSPCGWDGVTCAGGRVTRLILSAAPAKAPLPPEIGNLSELTHLDLWTETFGPGFMGLIPSQLGNLSKLEYLRLDGNYFSAQDVSVIGNLTSLKELSMNPLGDIPASFANLVNLERCTIGQYDPFPVGVWELASPNAIYQWPKIKVLRMAGVKFTTPISSQIGNLVTLDTLELGALTGPIPAEIGLLTNLTYLSIAGGYLSSTGTGNIPVQLGNLTNLKFLEISNIGLTGTIPASFNNLTNLKTLSLRDNALTGPIPDLTSIPLATAVDISKNKFTFAGMEENISRLDIYSGQAKIPLHANVIMGEIGGRVNGELAGGLFVFAGGTLANNTYRWYKNGALFTTTVGNEELWTDEGLYRVEVTNSLVPGLTLVSEDYNLIRLPVTLVSFDGKSENSQTKLTWKTTSETNNKGFEIERSADARTFEKIGFVDGNGDTKEDEMYHFTDLQPFETSYYRLKQLDYDGKFEYSKVIAVRGDQVEIKVYPNPAQELLTVSGTKSKSDVRIYNNAGRLVMKHGLNANGQVDIKGLSNGIYNVTIGGYSKKLLIQR